MYVGRILILIFFYLPLGLLAQEAKVDSLKTILAQDSSYNTQVSLFMELCVAYKFADRDSSLYYGEKAYNLAEENNDNKRKAFALLDLGYLFHDSGELNRGKTYFLDAIQIAEQIKDTSILALGSNGLGLTNWRFGNNELAIKNFQNTYSWAKISGNNSMIRASLNNLGLISGELGRSKEAIKAFEEVMALSIAAEDEEGRLLAVLNIAYIRQVLKEYDQALADYRKCIEPLKQLDDQEDLALTYLNIVDILSDQDKYKEALVECEKALSICQEYGILHMEVAAVTSKADILLNQKKYQRAINQAQKGLELQQIENVLKYKIELYRVLSEAYAKLNNHQQAYNWQKKGIELNDSMFQIDKEKEIAKLEISWSSKQKDAENTLLRKEKMVKDAIIAQRTKVVMAIATILFLLLIVAALLYRNRQKTKVMNVELEKRVKQRTEELEKLNKKLLQSNEEMQRFSYIASHDMKEPIRNIGGFIGLIKKRLMDRGEMDLLEYVDYIQRGNWQLSDLVDNIIEFSTINQEKEKNIVITNLNTVIEEVCLLLDSKIKQSNACIIFDQLPTISFNPAAIKMVLRRLIENAIQYNENKEPEVAISFSSDGESSTIIVRDNGIGIAPAFQDKVFNMFTRLHNRGAYSGSGMGLAFCKKLLENYQGAISLESEENKGSTFKITIPATIVHGEDDMKFANHSSIPSTTEN